METEREDKPLSAWALNITQRRKVGLRNRQTDRNKGKDGEKVSSLSTRQLVFKGLGVQNQPIPFQLCEEECLHELPAVMVQRRSTSSQNQ